MRVTLRAVDLMDPAAPAPETSSLEYHESLRVAWLITWRQTLIVMLASVLLMPVLSLALAGILTAIGVPRGAIQIILSLIPLLILPAFLQPILFLMAVNKDYRGFRIEALREDGHHEDLTIQECIAPSLILWIGGTVLAVILFLPIQFVTAGIVPPLALNVGVAPAIQVFFAYPLALALLFRFHRARFHSFRLHVARHAA